MKNQKKSSYISDKSVIADGTGKIPPQAIDMEEAVLGAMLAFPESVERVIYTLDKEMFYREAHGVIFGAIQDLFSHNEPIDLLTVVNLLRKYGKLEEVGGVSYLMQLTNRVLSDAHVEFHAAVVFDKYIMRELIRTSSDTLGNAFSEEMDLADVYRDADASLTAIGERIAGKRRSRDLCAILQDCITEQWERKANYEKGASNGIKSGFVDLDTITNGWQNSDLIILAARPSMGKTAVALKFTRMAAMSGVPVVFFSLEMSEKQIVHRMAMSGLKIDPWRYRSGNMTNDEMMEFEAYCDMIKSLPITIDDTAGIPVGHIRVQSKMLKKQGKCGLIVIDYLQLIREFENANRNREQAMAAISNQCKTLAKELNVPVIALSQLNRDCEKRGSKGHKPILADLRDSGAIEQDADTVVFVHREEKYGNVVCNDNGDIVPNAGMLIVSKQRNGSLGEVKFTHNGSMTEFYDWDKYGSKEYDVFG